MRVVTSVLGVLSEAWQETRVHRTRVLLSLVGVAVAVCSLTTVVALGAIMQQANAEVSERQSGRPALVFVSAFRDDGLEIDADAMQAGWERAVERYDVQYASRVVYTQMKVDSPMGVQLLSVQGVDQPWGEMHRLRLLDGTWFTADDERMLAPPVVINEVFWNSLGRPDLRTRPVISLGGLEGTTAVVTGVTPSPEWDTAPSMILLAGQLAELQRADSGAVADPGASSPPQYEMWVPTENWEALAEAVRNDLTLALGEGVDVQANRQDYAAYGDDSFAVAKLVVSGIAVLVLLLGALGLVNIALVTVTQRVREIGIRRSFGATAGRVFFAVMMESVVATVAAGVVGVGIAILLVQSPLVRDRIGQGIVEDFPPFPVDAALLGLVAASAVGALAGLLPALVAVRVKVIDAIRY